MSSHIPSADARPEGGSGRSAHSNFGLISGHSALRNRTVIKYLDTSQINRVTYINTLPRLAGKRANQVQSGMPGSPVAVRACACLLGR